LQFQHDFHRIFETDEKQRVGIYKGVEKKAKTETKEALNLS
jgi:hypothetical protein